MAQQQETSRRPVMLALLEFANNNSGGGGGNNATAKIMDSCQPSQEPAYLSRGADRSSGADE